MDMDSLWVHLLSQTVITILQMKSNSSKLILVVDDSTDNQDLLKMLLVAKGYNVYCVSNGKEALSLLSELSHLPDLILLDALMPIMDGHEFRVEQGKNDRIKHIPVVVMTGDTDEDMDEKMNHPSQIIMKPFDIAKLVESVSNFS